MPPISHFGSRLRRSDLLAAIGRAMHVGYPVAVVVADTLDIARDAAERVPVDYAPRPAVVSARNAFEKDAPQLYDSRHGYRAAQFEDAIARFLPPEPNIRTLKRGGGGKT
jgi:CO/xanthine dehydrogenase Mo-binding subunit